MSTSSNAERESVRREMYKKEDEHVDARWRRTDRALPPRGAGWRRSCVLARLTQRAELVGRRETRGAYPGRAQRHARHQQASAQAHRGPTMLRLMQAFTRYHHATARCEIGPQIAIEIVRSTAARVAVSPCARTSPRLRAQRFDSFSPVSHISSQQPASAAIKDICISAGYIVRHGPVLGTGMR